MQKKNYRSPIVATFETFGDTVRTSDGYATDGYPDDWLDENAKATS